MGTRTNFYKNPSIAYKKDLSLSSVLQNLKAYNIATGMLLRLKNGHQLLMAKRHVVNASVIRNCHRRLVVRLRTVKSKRTMGLCLTRIT
ncbi:hypothetical protein CerSpe_176950 [Prunus speciosa]